MTIFKKHMSRRAVLRGIGTAVALPLLDGMVPAFASAPAAKQALRLSFVYAPNGMIMQHWTPSTEGSGFELPSILEPLTPFRDSFQILSGLQHSTARPLPEDKDTDDAPHERAGCTYLTGIHPKREGPVGISVDQLAADELGKQTQLASLELGLQDNDVVGQCEKGWNCAVLRTLSWRTPTTPLPMENRPRAVFERLFGDSDSTDPAQRRAQIEQERSLLDSVADATSRLAATLSPGDRGKVSEYLDAIRDIERRIHLAEAQSSEGLPVLARPAGAPDSFDAYAKLMFDLNVLAYQSDLTRVSTFMMGREQSDRSFPEIGITDAHHALTHHQNDPVKIGKVVQINTYHSKLFAYFLDKMRSTPDGDGSLLDHTMIVYGSCISDGNRHLYEDLPVILAGGSAVDVKGGSHVRYPSNTPMTNLYLSLLDKLNVPIDHLGDSTGHLKLLTIA
jgi:Protein of unknown function (DUF1552)